MNSWSTRPRWKRKSRLSKQCSISLANWKPKLAVLLPRIEAIVAFRRRLGTKLPALSNFLEAKHGEVGGRRGEVVVNGSVERLVGLDIWDVGVSPTELAADLPSTTRDTDQACFFYLRSWKSPVVPVEAKTKQTRIFYDHPELL